MYMMDHENKDTNVFNVYHEIISLYMFGMYVSLVFDIDTNYE